MTDAGAASGPYVVLVRFEVDPARVDDFAALMTGSIEDVRATPGNRRYDFNRDPADPTRFMLYEVFDDEAAWAAHHARPELQRLLERIRPMLAGKPDRSTWTPAPAA